MTICTFLSVNYLKATVRKLDYSAVKVENFLKSNSFEHADKALSEFNKKWNNYCYKISVFTNHNEIDDINSQLQNLSQNIKYKNKEDSMISINTIKSMLASIDEMERVSIYNLF